jgi:ribosomal protein L7/L12
LKEAKEAVERIERASQCSSFRYWKPCRRQDLSGGDQSNAAAAAESGNKIEAIKLYRDVFEVGLGESKDAVEVFENGEDLPVPIGWGAGEGITLQDSDRVLAEVASLARQGNRLAAVKTYREAFDSSLQEAEQAVARLAQDSSSDPGWIVAQVRADLAARQYAVPADQEKNTRPTPAHAGVAVL